MEICLPAASDDCTGLCETDFDEYKIPLPTEGFGRKDSNEFILKFKNAEDAIKYAIHLNDVYDRMASSSEYDCSRKKIEQIIEAVSDQAVL
jgi:hypothetical protein